MAYGFADAFSRAFLQARGQAQQRAERAAAEKRAEERWTREMKAREEAQIRREERGTASRRSDAEWKLEKEREEATRAKKQKFHEALELIRPMEVPTELLPPEEYGEEDPTYSGAKYGFLENYLKELPKRRETTEKAKILRPELEKMMGRPVTQQEAENFSRMSAGERNVFLGVKPGSKGKTTDPTLVLKQYGTEITRALKNGGFFEGDKVAAGESEALNELIIEYRNQGVPFTISAYKDDNGEFRFNIQPHGGRGQLPPALEQAITPPALPAGYAPPSPFSGESTVGYEEGYPQGQAAPPKVKRIKRIN